MQMRVEHYISQRANCFNRLCPRRSAVADCLPFLPTRNCCHENEACNKHTSVVYSLLASVHVAGAWRQFWVWLYGPVLPDLKPSVAFAVSTLASRRKPLIQWSSHIRHGQSFTPSWCFKLKIAPPKKRHRHVSEHPYTCSCDNTIAWPLWHDSIVTRAMVIQRNNVVRQWHIPTLGDWPRTTKKCHIHRGVQIVKLWNRVEYEYRIHPHV